MSKKSSNKKSKRTMKRGGCGCNNPGSKSIFSGGNKKRTIRGGVALGPASLTEYDPTNQYTYSLFDITKSPLNPSDITDTRQLPNMTGGKRRRRKTARRQKRRTLRGGADPVIKNYENNLISSSNTSAGAANAADIVTAETTDIYSPLSKPLFL